MDDENRVDEVDEGKSEEEDIVEIIDARGLGGANYWGHAIVVLVIVLSVLFLWDRIIDVFKPEVTINIERSINTAVSDINKESKLVVCSAEVTAEIEMSHEKIWNSIPMGTTMVRVRYINNKVQYFIPADSVNIDSVVWNSDKNQIEVIIPYPTLDQDMVSVQSDPSLQEVHIETGWARFESRSGQVIEDQLRREMWQAVVMEGNDRYLLELASYRAKEVVVDLFRKSFGDDSLNVHVIFKRNTVHE